MIWLVLLGAFGMIVGAVLAVKPTDGQARVARVRERALKDGLHIKLPISLEFPSDMEKGRLPFYCQHLKNKKFLGKFYVCERDTNRIRTSSGDVATSLQIGIDNILLSANHEIEGFYLGNGLMGFSWQETDNQEVYEELRTHLVTVERLLGETT